ncbi:hypothetical protein Aduo_018272 [Ancylostoma duodenale]
MVRRSQHLSKPSVTPVEEAMYAQPQSSSSFTITKEIVDEYGKLSAVDLINAILGEIEDQKVRNMLLLFSGKLPTERKHDHRRKKKDYELKQIAKERNTGSQTNEWVVCKGEVRRSSELPIPNNVRNF